MTAFDMSESIQARSDQQNYDDYTGGISKVVTISEVRGGSAEQPVELHVLEFPGKPYKPSKSMRRVLVFAWGVDASQYVGRRLRLYGDPEVKFGGKTVGGIKIGAMSHIDKPIVLALTETRGLKKPHRVEPLPDSPPTPQGNGITAAMITAAGFENDENGRANWLAFASNVAGRDIRATKELTREEADKVRAELEKGESK